MEPKGRLPILVGETRVSDIAASFERRRPLSSRQSGESAFPGTSSSGTPKVEKVDSPGRPRSSRIPGEQPPTYFYSTNGADSPRNEVRRTLKAYRSSGMDSAADSVSSNLTGSDSPTPVSTRPLRSFKSGEIDLSKSDSNRRLVTDFTARGSGGFGNGQRFPAGPAPSPRERVGSQRSAAGFLSEAQPRDIVRVVSQRALTTQVAKSYLQTIEQQKLQSDKSYMKKKEEDEEEERWVSKKKTARRLLGSFSMYQLPGFSEIDLSGINETESTPSSLSTVTEMTVTSQQVSVVLASLPEDSASLSLLLNLDSLDDELEREISALIRRRALLRAMVMWSKVASHRAQYRKRQQKVYKMPNISFGRRRSRRPPPVASFKSNLPAAMSRRTSRLSVVRRPTTEDIGIDVAAAPPSEWFDLGLGAGGRKHQLNLGRRSVFKQHHPHRRESAAGGGGTPIKEYRMRKSTLGAAPVPPPTIRENERLRLDDSSPPSQQNDQFVGIPENSEVVLTTPPKALNITVASPTAAGQSGGRGLQRTVSWSQKGMGVIKSMFSGGPGKLSRVPSKEKMWDSKDKAPGGD